MNALSPGRRAWPLLALLATVGACATTPLLNQYEFTGSTLAVDCHLPAYPDVLTGPLSISSRDPVRAVLDVTTRAAREIQVGSLEAKLDTAEASVDLHALMRAGVGERGSRYLGATPQVSVLSADYVLQVTVLSYGIMASDWDATAYLFMDAEALLMDSRTGREIWRTQVGGSDPLGPEIFSAPGRAREVVTAAVLAGLDVDDLVRALERVADYTAIRVTDRLREDLQKARRGD